MSAWSNGVRCAVLAVIVAGVAVSAQAGALSGTRVGWGEVQITGQCTSCFTNSPKGSVAYVAYLGTGSYEIEMPDLYVAEQSDVQVSSADTALTYCTTAGWSSGLKKGVLVFVDCYDIGGNPANSYFTFLYQSRSQPFGSGEKGIAFLWADQPTESSYTPNLNYQFNSTGATNTMLRNETGSYTASLPGLTRAGGNVQVTAYGSSPARCKTTGWTSDQSGTSVNVLCFDSTGAAADEMFTLAYTLDEPLGIYHVKFFGDTGAYVWANKPDDTKTYTPAHAYNYNGFKTGRLTAQKIRIGEYTLTVPGETYLSASSMLVTAYGATNSFCIAVDGINEWYPPQVFCYDQNGNPVDSEFTALLQTDLKN